MADEEPTRLSVRVDLHSLSVREGTGGIKPLTDRDRREIAVTAGKVLDTAHHPGATYLASGFTPGADGGGTVSGTMTLAGTQRPVRLDVTAQGAERYQVTATVVQSEFGIKPYSAFLGALRVRDAVDIEVDLDLSGLEPLPDGTQ